MDRKKYFNLENPEDVAYLLETITDDMAVDSDQDGDDDADDNRPLKRTSNNIENENSSDSENSNIETEVQDEPYTRNPDDNSDQSSGSSLESSDEEHPQWVRASKDPAVFNNYTFTQHFGLTNSVQIEIDNPKQIFLNVLTRIFLQYIVDQSNLYALQNGVVLGLGVNELKAYIGILIIMGFHQLPSMRLYWSTDPNFTVPCIRDIMSLLREHKK